MNFLLIIRRVLIKSSPTRYIKHLRSKGVAIGENFDIGRNQWTINIDLTRPSLIEIGNNVKLNRNFTLLTHDFVCGVFRNMYSDFLPSSGKCKIGNNVHFGINVTVLKGVTIGDNCFIAAGPLVTKDIPGSSIAAGVPARVICNMEDYYERRKNECVVEAFTYAKSIKERFGRNPVPADFWEEFPLFVDAHNIDDYPEIPIKRQLGTAYELWLETHKAKFDGFEEFLNNILE